MSRSNSKNEHENPGNFRVAINALIETVAVIATVVLGILAVVVWMLVAYAFFMLITYTFFTWKVFYLLTFIFGMLASGVAVITCILIVYRVACIRNGRNSRGNHSKNNDETYPPEPGSEFKDWIIPLPDFRFHHEPYRGGDDYRDFIGRDALVQSFLDLLRHSRDRSGSYLITGYRGVGKTSFVHKALKDYAVGRRGPIPERRSPLTSNPLVQRVHWRYLQIMGELTLCWHRRLFRRQSRERTERRSYSLLLRGLVGRWLPQRGARWYIFLNFTGILWLLFAPLDPRLDAIVVAILLANHIQHNHGHLPARIRHHLFRWPWRPLVQVHVNLGYEIKEPKRVLFSLIALLRSQYESVTGYGSPAGLLRFVLIAALSLALAEEVYRRVNDTGAERFFQYEILGIKPKPRVRTHKRDSVRG